MPERTYKDMHSGGVGRVRIGGQALRRCLQCVSFRPYSAIASAAPCGYVQVRRLPPCSRRRLCENMFTYALRHRSAAIKP
jgi:hypothetical protein